MGYVDERTLFVYEDWGIILAPPPPGYSLERSYPEWMEWAKNRLHWSRSRLYDFEDLPYRQKHPKMAINEMNLYWTKSRARVLKANIPSEKVFYQAISHMPEEARKAAIIRFLE